MYRNRLCKPVEVLGRSAIFTAVIIRWIVLHRSREISVTLIRTSAVPIQIPVSHWGNGEENGETYDTAEQHSGEDIAPVVFIVRDPGHRCVPRQVEERRLKGQLHSLNVDAWTRHALLEVQLEFE